MKLVGPQMATLVAQMSATLLAGQTSPRNRTDPVLISAAVMAAIDIVAEVSKYLDEGCRG